MSSTRFGDNFKRDAVAHIAERGRPGQGGGREPGREPTRPLLLEEDGREGVIRRCREGRRDPSGPCVAGGDLLPVESALMS